MTFDKATTIEQQAQNMVEVRPGARATPTAHGAPADTKPTGDAS
jgi:hypothetical protein